MGQNEELDGFQTNNIPFTARRVSWAVGALIDNILYDLSQSKISQPHINKKQSTCA